MIPPGIVVDEFIGREGRGNGSGLVAAPPHGTDINVSTQGGAAEGGLNHRQLFLSRREIDRGHKRPDQQHQPKDLLHSGANPTAPRTRCKAIPFHNSSTIIRLSKYAIFAPGTGTKTGTDGVQIG